MVIYVLLSLVAWLTGTLICYADLRLLTGNYHFHLGKWQWVTYCLCILAVGLTLWELVRADCCLRLMCCVVFGCCYALSEWGLAKWSPHRIAFSVGYRLTILIGGTLIFAAVGVQLLTPFLLAGFWFRNSPFGTVHGFIHRKTGRYWPHGHSTGTSPEVFSRLSGGVNQKWWDLFHE